MDGPLVSIVIPVYNGANYLREAIDSALAQGYRHCEVLVINDGSTDNGATEAIALAYGERIRYFCKENAGVASALNMGITHMRGEFFSWLSHDDVYLPHKIAVQMTFVQSLLPEEQKRLFLFTDYTVINAQGLPLYVFRADTACMSKHPLYAVFKHQINGCTALVSRELLIEAGLFHPLPTTQDYDLWFRLIRLVTPVHLTDVTILSRHHADQGYRSRQARIEASQTFIRLLSSLSDAEILSCATSREAFFAELGHSFCEIDMRAVHDYAWARASCLERWLYYFSPKRLLKKILHFCHLLWVVRQCKTTLLHRP